MWLQLHMHQIIGIDLNNRFFPSSSYHEGEAQVTRGCHTYGEAASTVPINQNVSQLFELFFKGFPNPLWLPYMDNDNLTLPCEFSFEAGRQDGRFMEIFNILIHPCLLPAEFCGGRLNHSTYEYYQPNMVARQLDVARCLQDYFSMNSSNPEKKLKSLLNPAGFFSMNAIQPFIPGLSHLQQ
jgi:hypothetical protein